MSTFLDNTDMIRNQNIDSNVDEVAFLCRDNAINRLQVNFFWRDHLCVQKKSTCQEWIIGTKVFFLFVQVSMIEAQWTFQAEATQRGLFLLSPSLSSWKFWPKCFGKFMPWCTSFSFNIYWACPFCPFVWHTWTNVCYTGGQKGNPAKWHCIKD